MKPEEADQEVIVASSLEDIIKAGETAQDAIPIGAGVYMSKGIANSYLITTNDGNVLVNTGLDFEAPETGARFGRVSEGPIRYIIFTQGHPDHVGGWSYFDRPGVHTVAQANHADVREYWRSLHPFYVRRIMKLWGRFTADIDTSAHPPEPVLTQTFIDSYSFELGSRHFELFSTPGGETTDALVVWLPDDGIVFIGNLLGPMFGHVPNLYTVRGDKIRSAMAFIHSIDRVISLEPETLVNGHDVFRGSDEIGRTLTKIRDATRHLRDQTIEGMNAGVDLWALMAKVTLPPELSLPQMHGRVPWIVRAIWEEHTGWFRYESTTELYDVPPSVVWPDLCELAGGPSSLSDRARTYVDQHQPLHALHLVDIVLSQDRGDAAALALKREALEQLLAESGRENFSEVQWLESEITETDASLP